MSNIYLNLIWWDQVCHLVCVFQDFDDKKSVKQFQNSSKFALICLDRVRFLPGSPACLVAWKVCPPLAHYAALHLLAPFLLANKDGHAIIWIIHINKLWRLPKWTNRKPRLLFPVNTSVLSLHESMAALSTMKTVKLVISMHYDVKLRPFHRAAMQKDLMKPFITITSGMAETFAIVRVSMTVNDGRVVWGFDLLHSAILNFCFVDHSQFWYDERYRLL